MAKNLLFHPENVFNKVFPGELIGSIWDLFSSAQKLNDWIIPAWERFSGATHLLLLAQCSTSFTTEFKDYK